MRVRPDKPGGQLAQNQGLSVNAVASDGTASHLADQVILAPKPLGLDAEDTPMHAQKVASVPQVETTEPQVAAAPVAGASEALELGDVAGLVAQLTDGMTPLEEDETALEPIKASVALDADTLEMAVSNAVAVAMVEEPGVRASLRPKERPALRAMVTKASFAAEPSLSEVKEMSAASLPAGTRLVQLGAFDSPDIARAQWDALYGRFGDYLEGKARIVQEASSGGRTFYRLRAEGFADIAEARRFCAALVAENADCIPVVSR